ncbi:ABC transporter substrate-binding protein [Phytoactinopolyspora limicola]|uniref:ABC transporter substrate-binding protein n=1 Tax=Phytoactinopolyspora limicola TaxID=2715536 RepID=UPI001408880E|nr:ABC transporter substrate-binding protein [Phytoactinopolyspora limicola]
MDSCVPVRSRSAQICRHTRHAAGVIVIGAIMAGCAGSNTDAPDGATGGGSANELVIYRGEKHEGWHPDAATGIATSHNINSVMEPLLRAHPDGQQVEPGIAASWDYDPEGPSYTFVIDDDAAFSDGTPVTAADVAFSVEQWLDGPNYGEIYGSIANVVEVDERTVTFELGAPDSTLPVMLTWMSAAIIPDDFGGRSAAEFYADPIGAGAFAVESWTPGSEIVLTRNEHYYQPERPYLDRIRIVETDDVSQRAVSYEAGDADIVDAVSIDTLQQFPEDELIPAPEHFLTYAGLNVTREPFDDVQVRRAVAAAVDYGAVTELLQGYGSAPQGGLPENVRNWVPSSHPWHEHDPDLAADLLAETAAATDLVLIYDSSLGSERLVATVLQDSLAAVGIGAELRGLETAAFIEALHGLDYDIAVWQMSAISPDVIDPIGFYLVTDYLFTGYDTTTLGEVYQQYTQTTDEATQQTLIRSVQDEIHDQVPFLPLANYQITGAVKPHVDGFEMAPWGMYWLDELRVAR